MSQEQLQAALAQAHQQITFLTQQLSNLQSQLQQTEL
jgi:hypothetical protein